MLDPISFAIGFVVGFGSLLMLAFGIMGKMK